VPESAQRSTSSEKDRLHQRSRHVGGNHRLARGEAAYGIRRIDAMTSGLAHINAVSLFVEDLQAAKAFYSSVFGAPALSVELDVE
jgi:hypothetical protein